MAAGYVCGIHTACILRTALVTNDTNNLTKDNIYSTIHYGGERESSLGTVSVRFPPNLLRAQRLRLSLTYKLRCSC